MRVVWIRKSATVSDRHWTFRLIGSRMRGTAKPDSDWDVLAIPDPKIEVEARDWCEASEKLLRILGGESGARKLIRAAMNYLREEHGFERGAVDIFIEFFWNGRCQAARMVWDEERGCWEGWLTGRHLVEMGVDPRKAPSVGALITKKECIIYWGPWRGIWEIGEARPEDFEIILTDDGSILLRKDPYAREFHLPLEEIENLDFDRREVTFDPEKRMLVIRIPKKEEVRPAESVD
jgi:hypothetical protein